MTFKEFAENYDKLFETLYGLEEERACVDELERHFYSLDPSDPWLDQDKLDFHREQVNSLSDGLSNGFDFISSLDDINYLIRSELYSEYSNSIWEGSTVPLDAVLKVIADFQSNHFSGETFSMNDYKDLDLFLIRLDGMEDDLTYKKLDEGQEAEYFQVLDNISKGKYDVSEILKQTERCVSR